MIFDRVRPLVCPLVELARAYWSAATGRRVRLVSGLGGQPLPSVADFAIRNLQTDDITSINIKEQ